MQYISFKSNIHTVNNEVDTVVHRIHAYLVLHAHDALVVDAQVRLLGHAQRLCAYSTSLP